jgi:hypothetical protein
MSQANVERILGRLASDERFRRQFWANRAAVLAELANAGCELNPCERRALEALAQEAVERFAAALDPRLQKTDLCALGGQERDRQTGLPERNGP